MALNVLLSHGAGSYRSWVDKNGGDIECDTVEKLRYGDAALRARNLGTFLITSYPFNQIVLACSLYSSRVCTFKRDMRM